MKKARKLLKIIFILIISFMLVANTNIVMCTDKNPSSTSDSEDKEEEGEIKGSQPARGDTQSKSSSEGKSYTGKTAETIDENMGNAENFITKRRKRICNSR